MAVTRKMASKSVDLTQNQGAKAPYTVPLKAVSGDAAPLPHPPVEGRRTRPMKTMGPLKRQKVERR